MPLKVLAILPGIIPSTIIDVITPLTDLHKIGAIDTRIIVENFVKKKDIHWCDIIVLCRNICPDTAWWFLYALELSLPYIYDIDDNFFEIPKGNPLATYYRESSRQAMLKEYMRLARLVRVYSFPMYIQAKKINKNVEQIVAPIDWRLIKPPRKDASNGIVRIVYATSRSEDNLSEIFKPSLKKILEKYSNQVEMHFLGYNPEEFRKFKNVYYHPLNLDYKSYLKSFSSAGYDIGLAPLLNDVFHRSKTNNKFREYGASQIAGIYSNVDIYSTCVTHYESGLLIENDTDAWFQSMETLIVNPSMRRNIQKHAFEFVKKNYSQEAFAEQWRQQILQALSNKWVYKRRIKKAENLIKEHSTSNFSGILKRRLEKIENLTKEHSVSNFAGILKRIWSKIILNLNINWLLLKIRIEIFFTKSNSKD